MPGHRALGLDEPTAVAVGGQEPVEGDRHGFHPRVQAAGSAALVETGGVWGPGSRQRQRGGPAVPVLVRSPARVADRPEREAVGRGQVAGLVAVERADDPEELAGPLLAPADVDQRARPRRAPSGGRTTRPRSRSAAGRRRRRATTASVTRRTRLACSPSRRLGRRQNAAKSWSPMNASQPRTIAGSSSGSSTCQAESGRERVGRRAVVDQVPVAAGGGREPGVEAVVDHLGAPHGDGRRAQLVDATG